MTAFAVLLLESMGVVLDNYTRLRPTQEPPPLDRPLVIEVLCTRKVSVTDNSVSNNMNMPEVAKRLFAQAGSVGINLIAYYGDPGQARNQEVERIVKEA